jgi:hypothetical protein
LRKSTDFLARSEVAKEDGWHPQIDPTKPFRNSDPLFAKATGTA